MFCVDLAEASFLQKKKNIETSKIQTQFISIIEYFVKNGGEILC